MNRRSPRLRAAIALAALAVGFGAVASPQSASASLLDATCPAGHQVVTYSPGVTTASQTITVTYHLDLGACVSLTNPAVTNGTSSGTVTIPLSCTDLLSTMSATQDFTWNTGQTSRFSFLRTVTTANGQTVLTLTGTITSGLFAGSPAVLTVVQPTVDLLACQSPGGLTRLDGISTFVVS
jgi:hypothetical protein